MHDIITLINPSTEKGYIIISSIISFYCQAFLIRVRTGMLLKYLLPNFTMHNHSKSIISMGRSLQSSSHQTYNSSF